MLQSGHSHSFEGNRPPEEFECKATAAIVSAGEALIFSGVRRSSQAMSQPRVAVSGATTAPRLITPISLQSATSLRVALPQSSPPFRQPCAILKGEKSSKD